MKKACCYVLLAFLLWAPAGGGAMAGIGEVGTPQSGNAPSGQDKKADAVQEPGKKDTPGEFKGGIGGIGPSYLKPSDTQESKPGEEPGVKPVAAPAPQPVNSKPAAVHAQGKLAAPAVKAGAQQKVSPRVKRAAKIAYYKRYHADKLPKPRMTRNPKKKPRTTVLWRAMPPPPASFVKRYQEEQAVKAAKKKQKMDARPKTIPGLKGVPGLSGR